MNDWDANRKNRELVNFSNVGKYKWIELKTKLKNISKNTRCCENQKLFIEAFRESRMNELRCNGDSRIFSVEVGLIVFGWEDKVFQ